MAQEQQTTLSRVAPLPAGSQEAICPLFNEVFGHGISPALLHWKYGEGRGTSWVGWDADGLPLVHCGLFYRTTLVGGRCQQVAQLVDLMASPRAHGGISRKKAPFYLLIKPLLASIETSDNPGAWALGFPSDRAMRLGERLGVFKTIDQLYELTFAPRPHRLARYRFVRLKDLSGALEPVLRHLWEQMAADLRNGIVGTRDPAYLRQRYLDHPEKKYELYLVQSPWLRRGLGVCVVCRDGASVELMDIIAPFKSVPQIVRAAREWLYSIKGQHLKLWLTSSHSGLLADQAVSVVPLEFRIMANPMTPAEELQRFDHRWWLTSGDTDYR